MVCHNFVSAQAALSGVQHRNHCPYCLSSRHLDLFKAGDRLSACKASMRPVALSLKKTRKKYGGENQGEVMLVHLCDGCGKISINRIAADDDIETLLRIFKASFSLDNNVKSLIATDDIAVLAPGDHHRLRHQLYGHD
jgi:RNHCP domain